MDSWTPNVKSNANVPNDKMTNINTQCSDTTIKFVLECKCFYPSAFRKVCQELLNELNLQLDKSFLTELQTVTRSRSRLAKVITLRTRSRSLRRSLSPSGSVNKTEESWENIVDIATAIIDNIMNNIDCKLEKNNFIKQFNSYLVLPENFLNQPNLDKEVKLLLDDLKVIKTADKRKERLKKNELTVVGEAMKKIVTKIGVLLPTRISSEIELLKSLRCFQNNKLKKRKSHILAAQILLLNIPEQSRTLLQKIIELYRKILEHKTVKINVEQLYELLKISLFNGENNYSKLQLSKDFIHLSNRIFQYSPEMKDLIISKVKSKLNSIGPFSLVKCPPMRIEKPVESNDKSNLISIDNYFSHSKSIRGNNADLMLKDSQVFKQIPIIISSGNGKIPQLNTDNRTINRRAIYKQHSILNTAKKVLTRTMSPFRTKPINS